MINPRLILHPTDGSQDARRALEFAVDLARLKDARLLILHVQAHRGGGQVPPELEEYARIEHIRVTEADILQRAAEAVVEEAKRSAEALGASDVRTQIRAGDPVRAIVETARENHADMIVLGSRGLGDAQGLLLGSVSHKVAHAAPCTCIIVR
ncbi:universal stress protein [Jiella sp. M17.18]|uniref:universal stress protein n=1 Tax=Jiella sp. M17.18 TaxID=3234247 RepID=UPI0034DE8B72